MLRSICIWRLLVNAFRPLVDLRKYRISRCDPSWLLPPGTPPCPGVTVLITCGFGAERYQQAAYRLAAQARALGRFTLVYVFTNLAEVPNLSGLRRSEIEALARQHVRGWGLWSWKPAVVGAVMAGLPDGAEVFYVDAGCEISPWGWPIFDSWRCYLQANGYLFFSIPYVEREWTTSHVLRHFGLPNDLDCAQVQATWFGVQNRPESRALIEGWAVECLADNGRLLRVVGEEKNRYLLEHREDQSVLSCLIRSHMNIEVLPHVDHFLPELYTLNSWVLKMPIHTLRQIGHKSLINTLIESSSESRCIPLSASSSFGLIARRSMRVIRETICCARRALIKLCSAQCARRSD